MPDTGIHYLDGARLKLAVIAAAKHLISRRNHLDRINVFPVADSDTGTNMAAAARHLIDVLRSIEPSSLRQTADTLADAALFGGRGNSGAILAQFFQGFAEGIGDASRAFLPEFALAVTRGAQSAREAVSAPRDGTILTVMSDWSKAMTEAAQRGVDFVRALRDGHLEAERSLARTPDLLPILREANVVDAGAQGFLYLLDGVQMLVEQGHPGGGPGFLEDEVGELAVGIGVGVGRGGGGKVETGSGIISKADTTVSHSDDASKSSVYRWCIECLLHGSGLRRDDIRAMLVSHGDSVVVAGSSSRMRIHIHADDPGGVLDSLRIWGEVSGEKADDMWQQERDAHHTKSQRVAVMVDTASDLPQDILAEYNIREIPFRVFFGDRQFIDKVTLTNAGFYKRLARDEHHPKTTQPTQADFIRAYQLAMRYYEGAVSLHVPGALSGTYHSARKLASSVSERILVFDSNAGTVGMGLIALEAARAAREGADLETVRRVVESAISRTTTLIELATTDYLVKGGRISRAKGLVGRLLNVRVVLTVDESGEIVIKSRIVGGRDPGQETLKLVSQALAGEPPARLAVSHAAAPERAAWYVEQLRGMFGDIEVLIGEFAPALGTHTGPGAIGIGIMRSQ